MTGLAYLCLAIAAGRLIAGSFTLRRMSAHRQEQAGCLHLCGTHQRRLCLGELRGVLTSKLIAGLDSGCAAAT